MNKSRVISAIHLFENSLLVILITAIVCIALTQIVLRNIFDDGIIWAEPVIRALVLWIAMTGAMIATRKKKHLKIDVLSHLFKEKQIVKLERLNNLFAFLVCVVVCYFSSMYVLTEYEYAVSVVGIIPSWFISLIIPVCFGVMSIRYLTYTIVKR